MRLSRNRNHKLRLFSEGFQPDSVVLAGGSLQCGPELWQRVAVQAQRNGVQSGSIVSTDFPIVPSGKLSTKKLEERVISETDAPAFMKIVREEFKLGPIVIRRTDLSAGPSYMIQNKLPGSYSPSPDLIGVAIMFRVESGQNKYLVLVESGPNDELTSFGPQLRWIELV